MCFKVEIMFERYGFSAVNVSVQAGLERKACNV